ncbi:MAG: ABC transporter ATP-binding protein [Phototrophicaceae bacterium]
MGFIMDGLDAEEYDRSYTDSELVKRIMGYFKPQAGRMAVVAIAVLASSALSTAIPIYISNSLDQLAESMPTGQLIQIAIGLIALGALGYVFNAIRQWVSAATVGNVTLKLREDTFDAVLKRDLSFYDSIPSGKIVSRVTSDTQAFSAVVNLTSELMSQLLLVVLLLIYLFFVNVQLTLMTLALAPFIVIVALGFRRIARDTVTQSRRVNAEVNKHIQETISGIRIAKAFRQEDAVYDDFMDVNQQSYGINLKTGYTFSSIFPILNTVAGFGTAALVYFGGLAVRDASVGLSAGEWYLFIQGIALFWFPLTSIASFWSQFQLGLAAGERMFGLIDAETVLEQTEDNISIPQMKGAINFNNVDFSYVEGEPVLENFSLTIKAGETLALVGHTGSGKSSIGKLISRFYEFQAGSITIDDIDIRTLDLHNYHRQLGIVTQTPFMFDGTVADNIRYGTQDATDDDVQRVANLIANGDWLRSLRDGLDTSVGERGSSLSMGQRQLVVLARVLLQNPTIFILDEATASVDPLTETLIQEGLDTVLENRTSLVIAHRLSTIKNADRIIVLDSGDIIEQGTHDQLMAQNQHYAHLYDTYFRHQSLDYIESSPVV